MVPYLVIVSVVIIECCRCRNKYEITARKYNTNLFLAFCKKKMYQMKMKNALNYYDKQLCKLKSCFFYGFILCLFHVALAYWVTQHSGLLNLPISNEIIVNINGVYELLVYFNIQW